MKKKLPADIRPALTLRQASEALGVCISTLRVWCQKGIVAGSKPGRDWRIRQEEVDRLLNTPPNQWMRFQNNLPKREVVIPINFAQRGKKWEPKP